MYQPANGTEVDSTIAPRRFSGFHVTPGGTLNIESAPAEAGPYTVIATTTAGTSPITINGVDFYGWSASAVVPSWGTDGCGVEEAFVRARIDDGPFFLATFDTAESSGQTGLQCMLSELGGGGNLIDALNACASDDSPTARLTTGDAIYEGDVTISTQAEADTFACYTGIDGDLTIADDSAELSISLPNLVEVTGDLSIEYSRDPSGGYTPTIRSVDMLALETVGGNVTLHYPGDPSDLASWDVGLENVMTVGGDVSVTAETFNATISGLDSLTSIPGDLTATSTGDDYTIGGLLGSLTSVEGDVTVASDNTTTGMFNGLASVGGSLFIEGCYLPPGASNLTGLTSVAGDVELRSMTLVTVASLGNQFPALTSVGGTFDAESAGMDDLLIGDGAATSLGGLRLDSMGLDELTSTWITVDPAGAITITNNSPLTDCEAEDYVDAIGWPGTPTISGNGAC